MDIVIRIERFIRQFKKYRREDFSLRLEKLICRNLLHVGINTHDILRGYATVVEHLSRYDPSLVLVHNICRMIRSYVRQRPDTMRTIITFITSERPGQQPSPSNSNKYTLMMDDERIPDVNDEYVIMVDDNVENRWMDWRPDPYDANPHESRLFRESADVFNMLVSIYGSKDLFVKEYQTIMSERLITNGWDLHLHHEFVYLEIMKKRFNEGELNHCEVMLRDIRESAKLANYATNQVPFPVSPRIISSVYWPEINDKENDLQFLPCFKDALNVYESVYLTHKPARNILWLTDFGSQVEIEIDFEGAFLELRVPLIQAQILVLFIEKERWNVDELQEQTGLDKHGLKRRIDWWFSKGLIVPGPVDEISLDNSYCLAPSKVEFERYLQQQNEQEIIEEAMSDDEEEDQVVVEDMVEELEQYWNYTKNLLKFRANNDPPSAQVLHRLFKNFTSPGKAVPTLEAIQIYMQRKIRQNLVILENGVYKPSKELK